MGTETPYSDGLTCSRIIYGSMQEEYDSYAVLSDDGIAGLDGCNTRHILPTDEEVIERYSSQENVRVLILGMGAREAGRMRQLLPVAHITGMALSPINPEYFIPKTERWSDLIQKLCNETSREERREILGIDDEYDARNEMRIHPDRLLLLQKTRKDIELLCRLSDYCLKPSPDIQLIGTLRGWMNKPTDYLPSKGFDIVYENLGALTYSITHVSSHRIQTDALVKQYCNYIYNLLSSRGTCILRGCGTSGVFAQIVSEEDRHSTSGCIYQCIQKPDSPGTREESHTPPQERSRHAS